MENNVKIIHVSKMTGIAGAERHLLHLVAGLRDAGLDAEILVLTPPNDPLESFFAQAEARSIPTHQMPIRADLALTLLPRLRRFFRSRRCDIVHTHLIHADLYGALAARWAGVPHVVTSRHNDDRFRRRAPIRLLNRWLWGRVDHGIAISNWVRRFSIDIESAPPSKITTVHYGLDPDSIQVEADARADLAAELGLHTSAPLVGTVCRLTPQKGVHHALRAFWYVAKAYPAAHFLVTGDGPERPELEMLIYGLGLEDRVHFLGWRENPHAIIAALDVLLVPSLWEGFGMVLLEAMAQRVPIIASKVSAIPEIVINGKTGLLCPPGDEDAFASALSLFLEDPYLAREMGAQGRARLESQFTTARMVEGTRMVYQNMMP